MHQVRAMEAAAATDDEGCGAPIWSATTNWIAAADGSLYDAISFDTSEEIENEEVEAKPVLLLRPEGDDPPPCEITIHFRKKHEIHRVYVRSTARVYEIYYSSVQQNSNKEYLCTVRCGAAVKEMIPQATSGFQGNDNETAARPDQVIRSDSSNSDEDGWVQVKAPDPFPQNDKEYSISQICHIGMDSPIMQVHYEATAEISDYSPCAFLTLRLLSVQTKACVHIEEIYVYADPVESSNSDPPAIMGENMGGSSLLAMLVPSLMQLSKTGASRDRFLPEEARVSKDLHSTEKTAQTVSLDGQLRRNTVLEEACSWKSPDQKGGTDQEQTEVNPEKLQSESIQEVTVPHQMSNSLDDQNTNQTYSHLGKVLDNLVLKVERVEAFCSKFEENMLKPLSCMEQRLQQLEQKLDGLAVRSQSSEQCLCSRTYFSESNEYDSKIKGDNTKHIEPREDASFIATASPVSEVEPSVLESPTHPGVVIKAPEFLNEDNDCSDTEENLVPFVEDILRNKKPLSIDSALASSLAAFLTSTAAKSPNLIPRPTELPQEFVHGNNSSLDLLVGVPSERVGNLSEKYFIEENDCDFSGAARKETCFDDLSLLSHDAVIVNDELSSAMNKSCGKSDGVPDDTAFDDPLLVANADVLSPAFPSQADSGFIAMPPEFLYRHSSFNCDDTSESNGLDCLEERSSTPRTRQTVPPLAEFLSSTIVQSPERVPALFHAPSGLSSTDSNELSASIVALPSEGAESVIVNQEENVVEDEVYPDPILSTVPLEASIEQEGHDGMGWKEWISSEKTEGPLDQNLLESTFFELNAVVIWNCHGGTRADDPKEAVPHGFDQHSRRWVEDSSSTSSSLHENLIRQRVETEWPLGGSSDSSGEFFLTTNHSKWQAATSNDESDPVFAFEKAFGEADCTTGTCQSSTGCCGEKPNNEVEDTICNVKFTSERNWITGLPLELLLGEMPDATLVQPSTSGGDDRDDDAAGELLHNSPSSQGIDWENDSNGGFLSNVPPCRPPESTTEGAKANSLA